MSPESVPSSENLFPEEDRKQEIILNDGRFATLYKVRMKHVIPALMHTNTMMQMVHMIVCVVKIDDKPVSYNEVLELVPADFKLLSEALGTIMNSAIVK